MNRKTIKRGKLLTARLTEAEHAEILKAKNNSGLTISELIREAIKFYSFYYPGDNGKPDNNNQRGAKKAD